MRLRSSLEQSTVCEGSANADRKSPKSRKDYSALTGTAVLRDGRIGSDAFLDARSKDGGVLLVELQDNRSANDRRVRIVLGKGDDRIRLTRLSISGSWRSAGPVLVLRRELRETGEEDAVCWVGGGPVGERDLDVRAEGDIGALQSGAGEGLERR